MRVTYLGLKDRGLGRGFDGRNQNRDELGGAGMEGARAAAVSRSWANSLVFGRSRSKFECARGLMLLFVVSKQL